MGTVGLSFGSPTSGAGFDVSSTVAAIVGNLQNVETPWKNQLTALESQDTAISSLGTLFSNLSNDLSSLTDLEGILSEKTGSSSDTNVLSLTAANSTAIAGTHTVEVANLAQTSSGYLAPIANAGNTLAGSITLAVGNGKAQTITLNSSDDTLAGLAAAINGSSVGVTASVLTDASGSRLSLVSGTSGANGNIAIGANSIVDTNALLGYSGSAGTASANSTGTLASIANAADTLSGSLSVQVGSGTVENVVIGAAPGTPAANTVYTGAGAGADTLAGVVSAINAASIGFTAQVVTNSDGSSSLSLLSQTAGTAGTLTVNSSILDTTQALGYTSTVVGKDANLTVDGIGLTSASNTVANLIPGVTFQLLAPSTTESDGSLDQVQVVIGNDNTDVESTMNQFVTDYNSLVGALNTQEGNNSSGSPEALFGSPTLSLLQQQILGGLNTQNPNGSLDTISSTAGILLSGSLSIAMGGATAENIVIGAAPSTPAANTYYTGSGVNTLAGLAGAINSAGIGVTATVVTTNGESTLSLLSETAGESGALTIDSQIAANTPAALAFTGTAGTAAQASSGTLTAIANASDTLQGSVSIQVGGGTAHTVNLPASPGNTLAGLVGAINGTAGIGVTASLNTAAVGSQAIGTILTLTSNTSGTAGTLTVSSSILDTTNSTSKTLNYANSSDIGSLTGLGISVNNDGTIALDSTSLDSMLNSDYGSVVGFFQNPSGWGQTFSTVLTNAGTSSPTGVLALASTSNSNIESTLNADITKENLEISAQQISLTNELNTANQIMQQLPSQLQGVNELYSAITGYDQNSNG
jgi:flagellar hook-associated protein 2